MIYAVILALLKLYHLRVLGDIYILRTCVAVGIAFDYNYVLRTGYKTAANASCIAVDLKYGAVSVYREPEVLFYLIIRIVLCTCPDLIDIVVLFLVGDIIENVLVSAFHLVELTAQIKVASAIGAVDPDLYAVLVDIGILEHDTGSDLLGIAGFNTAVRSDSRLPAVNAEFAGIYLHFISGLVGAAYSDGILAVPVKLYGSGMLAAV